MIIKKNDPKGSSAPALGLIYMHMTITVKHVYWYMYIFQISGERLQDHWSPDSLFSIAQ